MFIEKKIKYITLSLLMLIISCFGYVIIYKVHDYIDNNMKYTLNYQKVFESKIFNEMIEHHSEEYSERIDNFLKDDTVLKAFSLRQRELLYTKSIDTFREFTGGNSNINIFTFRLPDGSVFLRVHKPEMFGDQLNVKRKIISDTNIVKKRQYGFEIDKLKMTYRIVTPIFKDNKYLGLVELGISPEAFVKTLNEVNNLKYALVIHKYMSDVMIKKISKISKNDYQLVSEDKFFQNIFRKISVKERMFISLNDKHYAIDANLILRDHNGNIQAFYLTSVDVTEEVNKEAQLKWLLFGIIIIGILLSGLILNYSLNYYIKSIKNMFYTDELTQLANRDSLLDKLKNITDNSSMFLIDINSFKTINELYGVDVGNNILKNIAEIIEKIALSKNMSAFRISSDEFILLSLHSSDDIIKEVHMQIKEHHYIFEDLNIIIDVDITIGAVKGKDTSLEKVDMALKSARKENLPYTFYTEQIDTKKDTKKIIQTKIDIKYALENNNIVPYFQPIVDKNSKIVKYEALMRMIKLDGEDREVILPFHFLDLSFKFNLYPQLSKRIIEKTFEIIEDIDKQISINLAPSDVIDKTMNKYILEKLAACSKAYNIIIEITENEDIKDFRIIKNFIGNVKKTGAKIAIDDFGSGYANYSNVFELKPDYIKIDGSLIKDIIINKENRVFVKTIISLSKELGVKTIAEYVHSKEVFELVKSYGVDEFQGFYFGEAQEKID